MKTKSLLLRRGTCGDEVEARMAMLKADRTSTPEMLAVEKTASVGSPFWEGFEKQEKKKTEEKMSFTENPVMGY